MTTLSFCHQKLSPRANVFLLVNLGCEMLYVVDQRLKSQKISAEKSFQVINDVTTVMLEPKFIDSIIIGSTHVNAQLLSAEHCKFMLKDVATSSLMRLDEGSMEKLWNLMTMLFKWQLFVSKYPHHLIDITFRHLKEIAKIQPDPQRNVLIEFTKNKLLDFWNAHEETEQMAVYETSIAWLQCFNTKISVLIRLGFQTLEGDFVRECDASYFKEFVNTSGDNIYEKSVEIAAMQRAALNKPAENMPPLNTAKYDVSQLTEMLNCHSSSGGDAEDLKPIDATNFQKLFVKNLQQCNILFEDLDVNAKNVNETNQHGMTGRKSNEINIFPDSTSRRFDGEFVQMKTVYNREHAINNDVSGTHAGVTAALTKDLLDFYSKMK